MSDSISEQEPKSKERIIKLNEEFTPWDSTFTRVMNYVGALNRPSLRFESDIYRSR